MARKTSGTILQEELYPSGLDLPAPDFPKEARTRGGRPVAGPARDELDDARLVDLDVDEQSPFLRGQKRVSARRASLPKKTASRLLWASIAVAVLGLIAIAAAGVYEYGERSWRFRIDSSDNIDVTGTQNVTKAQIMEVMGSDIGRNIFFIPLAQQKEQIEQIPWVESASVMRFVPNRLKVEIHERVPVAFARVGPRIALIDAGGTLMEMSRQHKYDFPVILGMNPGEPLSTRAPRMQAYNELVRQLDSAGAHYSQDLSEVDLSDLENLKVRVNDPAGAVLVELGSSQIGASDFLKRYQTYQSHVQEWRQQFQRLESVNLRYDNQAIVNPDMVKPDMRKPEMRKPEVPGKAKLPTLTAAAVRNSSAAGMKPAALTMPIGPHDRVAPLPKPAFELTQQKLDPKAGKSSAGKAKGQVASKGSLRTKAGATSAAAKRADPRKAASQKANAKKPTKSAPATAGKAAGGKPSPATPKVKADDISD